ncbi:hypothetical protein QR680_011084 [Steinernema hermaphroditum]|uniref:Uncharacterized protein n=1 Tax=Steinernema hermaphroditum TaxID=289476 RepID=A0AA39MC88_9BILA|nr:hypothetical protein QR680_011084 [Steinernema hermaphroditum]
MRFAQNSIKQDIYSSRDIRFFAQSSVQNISMILTSLSVLLAGSTYRGDDDAWRISGLSMIIVTHICNAYVSR